jgi:hypothetical protein
MECQVVDSKTGCCIEGGERQQKLPNRQLKPSTDYPHAASLSDLMRILNRAPRAWPTLKV